MPGPVLWLLRHGKAAEPLADGDAARPLTERGEAQSVEVGHLLKTLAPTLSAVITSPRVRALRTAELAVQAHGSAPDPLIFDELGGDYTLDDLLVLTSPWLGFDDEPDGPGSIERDDHEPPAVLVVGHNPTLTVIAHQLTGDERGMKTGTIVGVDLASRELVAHITPDA
ncbi:MAG: histidine phosphatase family protein [Solirubrobacteraceae bacterium]|nr:histidine phosphatase family protein [Patulibacter sp.]